MMTLRRAIHGATMELRDDALRDDEDEDRDATSSAPRRSRTFGPSDDLDVERARITADFKARLSMQVRKGAARIYEYMQSRVERAADTRGPHKLLPMKRWRAWTVASV